MTQNLSDPLSSPGSQPSGQPQPEPASPAGSDISQGSLSNSNQSDIASQGLSQQTPQQTESAQSVRDVLASYGLDLREQYPDDHQALQYLVLQARQAQQLQQLAQYGQTYLQNAGEFETWRRQQQLQQEQSQAGKQQSWWKAPEYDPRWENMIVRDQAGNLVPAPGAPGDVVQKMIAWRQHQQNFLDKFSQDPISAIKPGIEEIIQAKIEAALQGSFAQYHESNQATAFVQQNSHWIYRSSPNGEPLRDPLTGQKQFTEAGRRFVNYVNEASQLGMRDSGTQQAYAQRMLEADFAKARWVLSQQQAGNSGAGTQQQFPQQQAPQQAQIDPAAAVRNSFLASQQAQVQQPPAGNTNGVPAVQKVVNPSARELAKILANEMKNAGFQSDQSLV